MRHECDRLWRCPSGAIAKRRPSGSISFWVVYNRPKDYPDKFVTRKFLNDCPTDEFFVADSLSDLKTRVPVNCVFLPPSVDDDPKIVGVWMEGV